MLIGGEGNDTLNGGEGVNILTAAQAMTTYIMKMLLKIPILLWSRAMVLMMLPSSQEA